MKVDFGDNVAHLPGRGKGGDSGGPGGYNGGNSGSGGPPDMEARLRNLEENMAVVKSNYATSANVSDLRTDVHKLNSQTLRWMFGLVIGSGFALAGLLAKGFGWL